MQYTDAIKKGFDVVNKNWQLVLLQVGMMFVSFIGFLIIVGIPLAIAFIIFGLDLTGLSRLEDFLSAFKNPTEIISRYFWLVLLVLSSLLFYIILVFVMGIFLLSGSIGVINRSARDVSERFTVRSFLNEARRLFFPLTWFTVLIVLIFIVLAFILGLFGGVVAAIVSLAKEQAAILALFIGLFFSIIMFVIGLTLILAALSVIIYGIVIMVVRGLGPFTSIKEAIRYLYKNPKALYLYCLVFGGYLVLSFFIIAIGYPLKFIPFIGPLLTFIYQAGTYILQSYLGLMVLATIFSYYYSNLADLTGSPAEAPNEDQKTPISESSTPETDTSGSQAPGQAEVPQEKELNG